MTGRSISAIGAVFLASGLLGGCTYYAPWPAYVYVPCTASPGAAVPPGAPPVNGPPAAGTPSNPADAECLAPAPVYAYPVPGLTYPYYPDPSLDPPPS